MPDKSNLLIALHNWAFGQDENFTTEVFSHLLRYLLEREPEVGRKLIETLTGDDDPDWLPLAECEHVEVNTQFHTEDHGKPDICIQGENFCIYVEVKVGSPVGKKQLKKYKQGLAKRNEAHKQLVLLGSRVPRSEDIPEEVFQVRWSQIYERLEEILKNEDLHLGKEALFLVRQSLGFFEYQDFSPLRPVTDLSIGLKEYLDRIERDQDTSIFATKARRSLEPLKLVEELRPLYDLLSMMQKVVEEAGFTKKSYQAAPNGGWVGYSVNNMEYFFYLWFERPEIVEFQKFQPGVDPDKWKKGDRGETRELSKNEGFIWENKLNLEEMDFFSMDKDEQELTLRNFFDKSLAYSIETWGHWDQGKSAE